MLCDQRKVVVGVDVVVRRRRRRVAAGAAGDGALDGVEGLEVGIKPSTLLQTQASAKVIEPRPC